MSTEIINTCDQLRAAGGGIAICYRSRDRWHTPGWQVLHIGANGLQRVTDKTAHWADHGKKTFTITAPIPLREQKPKMLVFAMEWAQLTYGLSGPWARNRMGDYVLKEINDKFPLRPRQRKSTKP